MRPPERSRPGSAAADRSHLALLITGAFVSSLGFTLLQEGVWRVPGYHFSAWLVFLTYSVYACAGWLQWTLEGQRWHGRLQDYAVVAMLATAGYYLTNCSLGWLDYPTRIAFKSSKMLPVMAVRSLVLGTRYSPLQYGAAVTLVGGIALFSSGGRKMPEGESAWPGVLLITLALCCDALVANLEEAWFFRAPQPSSQAEVAMGLSVISAAYALLITVITGELGPAAAFSWRHKHVVPLAGLASLAGYAAVVCVLALIQHHGSVLAECVKSLRKVLQVAASLLVFGRPWSLAYAGGLGLMACGMGMYQGDRARRRQHSVLPGADSLSRPGRWRSDLEGISEHSETSAASSGT